MEEADSQVVNLRTLLSLSESVCVSNFIRDSANIDYLIVKQKSELHFRGVFKWCKSLDSLIEILLSILLEQWEIPVVSRLVKFSATFYNATGKDVLIDDSPAYNVAMTKTCVMY